MCVFEDNNNNNNIFLKLHFLLKRKLKFEGKKKKKIRQYSQTVGQCGW